MCKRQLFIMRGASGSGKSTKAHQIVSDFRNNNGKGKATICSADDYFIKDGKYNFNPKLLGKAHGECKNNVKGAMVAEVDLIIVDCTNTRHWEMEPYIILAKKYSYKVKKITVGKFDQDSLKLYASRNKHRVSLEIIEKQAQRFQK